MTFESRRNFLFTAAPGAAALGLASAGAVHAEAAGTAGTRFDVTDFGAVGDGTTPGAEAFQRAIDAAEAVGGGIVHLPAGVFLLEKTPLIASRVHLRGTGAASVLRGLRPQGHQGAALISNKGQDAPGYEGAHDWSISHLAIDSPDTNGIVITHAARIYLGFIYGVDVFHHFVDAVGRDILCENLYLTGRSGTSSFQIDSVSGAQTIWDGEQALAPLRDGTDCADLILRSSIITATAGHTGNRPQHDASIHFHGDATRGFLFSDLILGGASTGFYQDAGSAYHDIQINNVRSHNPGRALWFEPGKTGQQHLMVRGLIHSPRAPLGGSAPYRGIEIHGREGLLLSDLQLDGTTHAATDFAVKIVGSGQARISGLEARGHGGRGILLLDDDTLGSMNNTLIQGCLLRGFDTGCAYAGTDNESIIASSNLFTDVGAAYHGLGGSP